MRPDLRRGRIVWASVRDPRGNVKHRPSLIVTPTDAINDRDPIVIMAITTTFPDPPPQDHVPLPWKNGGHPTTKLSRRSAAVTSWLDEIEVRDVMALGGDVPPKLMLRILELLSA